MREYGVIGGIKTYQVQTAVLGTGAAGYNAACLLKKGGADDLVIITESRNAGTSRNTGSDKQTYYKLSLAGDDPDSVCSLASDLFAGRAVDGDIALCEAALSSASFLRLADMGVPFPVNRYGEYIGYKTDHDPHRRATSAGPYTSRFMTECLEKEAESLGIELLDGYQAVRLLVKNEENRGLFLISRKSGEPLIVLCSSLVFATGGPAGIYSASVYPESQFGATGIAFEAGCMGRNLTEWQYGLASVKPRWNVSGSYMQVIPRFVSIDEDGREYDFLSEYAYQREKMLSLIFLKGYQWPFDVRKLKSGSSIIDILCYLQIEKGRRVYLDFMHNPDFQDIPWDKISDEASCYLKAAGATGDTPIERLKKLNMPAYSFYLDKGVDLENEYLEISLSAQHNNGGLAIDSWWQSNIKGLFPVGECAASHGVYRPGGSALNAGQCGSRRAASWICQHRLGPWSADGTELEKYVLKEKGEDLYNILLNVVATYNSADNAKYYEVEDGVFCGYTDQWNGIHQESAAKLYGAHNTARLVKSDEAYENVENDLFVIVDAYAQQYRGDFSNTGVLDTIKIFRNDDNSYVLYEKGALLMAEDGKTALEGFLGMENIYDPEYADMHAAMLADTAYHANTWRPMYMLAVGAEIVEDGVRCPFDELHNTEAWREENGGPCPHAVPVDGYITGRYLVNLVDSAKAGAALKSRPSDSFYS